jgi:hypothetical protein
VSLESDVRVAPMKIALEYYLEVAEDIQHEAKLHEQSVRTSGSENVFGLSSMVMLLVTTGFGHLLQWKSPHRSSSWSVFTAD